MNSKKQERNSGDNKCPYRKNTDDSLTIAIAAVAGMMGLTVTQEVEAHCDGIGNCNGIQGSGSGGSGNDGGGDGGDDN
jgi:hypothetical protein